MQPFSLQQSLQEMSRPNVVRRVFPNGLTLLVQEDHSHPLVAFHAVVRTGSATEGPCLGAGVSHVVEHMLFKGTARRPVGAVEQEARSYGGTSQGFTTYDTTGYQLLVNREYWSEAADLLVDALFFPSMDPGEFAKEREVVLRELKLRRDDPAQVAWDELFANAYRVHPYRIPIIGYEPLLTQLTPEDVKQYHRTHYFPNTMVIAVVGDVNAEEVVQRMQELTASIRPGRVPSIVMPEEPLPQAPRKITEEAEANLAFVSVGFPGVSVNDPDLFALDLLSWLLGGGRGSRLELALREAGIVHSVHSWNYTPQARGLVTVSMRTDPDRVSEALTGMEKEFKRAKEEPFSPEEIVAGKKALLRDYLSGRQTVGGQASDLATYEVMVGDPTFADRYLAGVDRVSAEDLRHAAQHYLVKDSSTLVSLLPRGRTAVVDKQGPGQRQELVAEKVRLDNGLRVILRQDPRLPLVTVQVSMLGGVRYETDKTNGISGLTARMLTRGTRHKGVEEITELLRQMGSEVNSFSGRNSLGLTLELVSSELPRGLDLLSELLLEPSFPQEDFEKERRLALANLKTQEEDPFPWGMRRLVATLFTQHPYRLDPAGNADALKGLKRQDLVAFHERILDPQRIVVSIVGNFKREEVLALIRRTLGRMERKGAQTADVPPEPVLTSLRERIESTPRQEALVLIGFPGLRVGDPKVPALDLVEAVLSGGAGRLFSEVRERRGLAYTVGAFAVHGVDPGSFVLYAVTDPSHIEEVRSALLEEVRRLGTSLVADLELRQAKQGLLGNRRIGRQTQQALAVQMASDELYGLGFDFSDQYEAQVQKVTPEQVQAVARDLFNLQRYVVVIGKPGPAGALGNAELLEAQQAR